MDNLTCSRERAQHQRVIKKGWHPENFGDFLVPLPQADRLAHIWSVSPDSDPKLLHIGPSAGEGDTRSTFRSSKATEGLTSKV